MRRFDYVIPFLPMSDIESQVMADGLIRDRCNRYAQKPITTGLEHNKVFPGPLKIHYNKKTLPEYFSKFYSRTEGGAAIITQIRKTIDAGISHLYYEKKIDAGSVVWLNLEKNVCMVVTEPPKWFVK